jgi:acyl phosphate:glycerol-3-phosphate acyltransferase
MILRMVLCAVIGYLLGGISTGILLSRKAGTDIRSVGSRNTGASNVLRVLGAKYGALTFLGDALKAILSIVIGRLIAGQNGGMVAGLLAVIGHNWPVFFSFRGGKGIACSTAVLLTLFPLQGSIAVALCLAVIFITRFISLGSIVMLVSFTALMLFPAMRADNPGVWPLMWALALMLMGLYRHRENIQRLINGTENKVGSKKKNEA